MKIKKNTTFRSYLFGDFDGDGTKNIDDPKPFDPKKSKWPSPKKNPGYYHKARWGNNEVLLSDELRAWKKNNNRYRPLLNKFLNDNPGAEGRIKTVPSTMKKLRERYINKLGDIAGVRVLTNNRATAKKAFERTKRKYPYDPKETDDYYAKPLGKVYYAYHTSLKGKKGVRVEAQFKSREMSSLSDKTHKAYKLKKPMRKYIKKGKMLYKKGY